MHIWFGNYGVSAIGVAVEHCLVGHKARSEYVKKPLFSEIGSIKEDNGNMELVAVFEMKKRTHMLEMLGLPESPI